jgi:hypothetical protein
MALTSHPFKTAVSFRGHEKAPRNCRKNCSVLVHFEYVRKRGFGTQSIHWARTQARIFYYLVGPLYGL